MARKEIASTKKNGGRLYAEKVDNTPVKPPSEKRRVPKKKNA